MNNKQWIKAIVASGMIDPVALQVAKEYLDDLDDFEATEQLLQSAVELLIDLQLPVCDHDQFDSCFTCRAETIMTLWQLETGEDK